MITLVLFGVAALNLASHTPFSVFPHLIAGTNNPGLADALNRSERRLNLLLAVLFQFLQDFI